eukprot:1443056-Pyramimonas_sp.AAC.1
MAPLPAPSSSRCLASGVRMSLSRCSSLVLPAGSLPCGMAKLARLSCCRMSACQGVVVLAASADAVSAPGRALSSGVGR